MLLLAAATATAGTGPGTPPAEAFDPQASRADFTVELRMTGAVPGHFRAIEGELEPAGDGRWRVVVRVDTRALELDGPRWMQRATRSRRFLDVETHPSIEFRSAPFVRGLLREGGDLAGALTLRGVSREVVFRLAPSTCDAPGHDCPILVHGAVDRRDFGMTAQRLWLRDTVGFEFQVRLRRPG